MCWQEKNSNNHKNNLISSTKLQFATQSVLNLNSVEQSVVVFFRNLSVDDLKKRH